MPLSWSIAGDSHGRAIVGVLTGLPAGVPVDEGFIRRELHRRQTCAGRSIRQKSLDEAELLGGVWEGKTSGAPVGLLLENRGVSPQQYGPFPRPGHADAGGARRLGHTVCDPVAERASGRMTALDTAMGALAQLALKELGIETAGFVTGLGRVVRPVRAAGCEEITGARDSNPFYAPAKGAAAHFQKELERARDEMTTVGGLVEVRVWGLPPGLGDPFDPSRRLDAQLAHALSALPSVKGVSFGDYPRAATLPGRAAQDPFSPSGKRLSNRAGGLEGGVTNGETVVVHCTVKPPPTQQQPLPSVHLKTGASGFAPVTRHDVTQTPALSVVAQGVVALTLLDAVMDACGGTTIGRIRAALSAFGQ